MAISATIPRCQAARSSSTWPSWSPAGPHRLGLTRVTHMERIRLLLVDDPILFRQSLGRLLGSETDFEVVADCGTTDEALEVLERRPVDVVLLDFDLGHERGGPFIAASRRAGHA